MAWWRKEQVWRGQNHCSPRTSSQGSKALAKCCSPIARLLPLPWGRVARAAQGKLLTAATIFSAAAAHHLAAQDWGALSTQSPFRIVLSLIYLSQSSLAPVELSTSILLLGPRTIPVRKRRRRKLLMLAIHEMTVCWRKLIMCQIMHK